MPGPPYLCELLADHHELGHFECGDDPYDEWLIDRARTAQEHLDSTVYVLVEPARPEYVLAYFTLSSSNVSRATVTGRFKKHASFEVLPATLIGMLARHRSERGMLGHILRASFERAVQGSRLVASRLLVIDAGDERLAGLYEEYGFTRAKQVDGARTIRLIYLMHDLIEALSDDAAEDRGEPEGAERTAPVVAVALDLGQPRDDTQGSLSASEEEELYRYYGLGGGKRTDESNGDQL